MKLARKTHKFPQNLPIPHCFDYGPGTYVMSLKFRLFKLIAIFPTCEKCGEKSYIAETLWASRTVIFWDTEYTIRIVSL